MKIGTWNLAGRWSRGHEKLLLAAECDVWLLTELPEQAALEGFRATRSEMLMAPGRRWAAVVSRHPLEPLPDPHPASAAAVVNSSTFCASVLPWRSCGSRTPWVGTRHTDKTAAAVSDFERTLRGGQLVWGGDWNHALDGPEYAGSLGGRGHLLAALERLGLQVPTAKLPHRIDGLFTIDHVAVGAS